MWYGFRSPWPWITAAALIAAPRAAGATEFRQLTSLGPGWYDAGIDDASWSPDGAHVAFTFSWVDPGHWFFLFARIGIVPTGGGSGSDFPSQDRAHEFCGFDVPFFHPDWSPAGDRIVFSCGVILVGAVAETLVTAIPGAQGVDPVWSPDGTRIAYSYGDGILVIPVEGGTPSRLTSGPDRSPGWSADGQWIAFASSRGGQSDIWIVPAAGGEPRRLTDDAAVDAHPAWSPDGALVAFASDRSGSSDIWVVRVENGALSQVTDDPAWDGTPDWSPDGSQIAFTSNRSGYSNIWIASDLRTIAVEPATWSRVKMLYR